MRDVHAGYVVTLTASAPDRLVELLADPTSTEVVGQLPSTKVVVLAIASSRGAPYLIGGFDDAITIRQFHLDAGAEKLRANVVHKEKWEEHTRSTTLARIHYTLFSTCHA
jgi:hypothetical protein